MFIIATIAGSTIASTMGPNSDKNFFTLDEEEAAHHFTPMGTLIPAAGHAHLIYSFNITEVEEAATKLMDTANYLMLNNKYVPDAITWPLRYTDPSQMDKWPYYVPRIPATFPKVMPPSPLEYMLDQTYPWDPKNPGKSAVNGIYFVNSALTKRLTDANEQFFASGAHRTMTLDQFLNKPFYAQLIKDCQEYLATHSGPHVPREGHGRYSAFSKTATVEERARNPTHLPFGALIAQIAHLRLHINMLKDIGSPVSQLDFNPRHMYAVSQLYWPHQLLAQSTRHKRSTNSIAETLLSRSKRGALTTLADATESFVCTLFGYYTNNQVRHLLNEFDQRSLQRDKILAHQISANSKLLGQLKNATMFTAALFDDMKHTVSNILILDYLTLQVADLRQSVNSLISIMDALHSNKPSVALLASYQNRKDIQALYNLAKENNQNILLNKVSDILQCPTTFTLHNGLLRTIIHIPIAHEAEQLDLYSFTPYPFLLRDNSNVPYVLAQVDHANNVLAVNKQQTLYRAMTPVQLNTCLREGSSFICNQGSILHTYNPADPLSINGPASLQSKSIDHCLFAIFTNQSHIAHKACNLILKPPTSEIRQASAHSFHGTTFLNNTKGVITCGNHYQRTFLVPNSFRLTLHPSCTANLLGFRLKTGDSLTYHGSTTTLPINDFDLSRPYNLSSSTLEQIKRITMESDASTPTVLESVMKQLEQEEQVFLKMSPQESAFTSLGAVTIIIIIITIAAIVIYCKYLKPKKSAGTTISFTTSAPHHQDRDPLMQQTPPPPDYRRSQDYPPLGSPKLRFGKM